MTKTETVEWAEANAEGLRLCIGTTHMVDVTANGNDCRHVIVCGVCPFLAESISTRRSYCIADDVDSETLFKWMVEKYAEEYI